MSQEIERKYLVRLDVWKPTNAGVLYRQGYLSSVEERSVRVRIAGEQAYLTIKGPTYGITRLEFEYAIPVADAAMMLNLLCQHPLIEKLGIVNRLLGKFGKSMSFTAITLASSSPKWKLQVNRSNSSRHLGSGAKCLPTRVISIPALSITRTKIGATHAIKRPSDRRPRH